jgi:hypothetical protein
MYESNGLIPHPPEPAIIIIAKKLPYISTTKRATIMLYGISALFFLISIFILVSTVKSTSRENYYIPDSFKTIENQSPTSKP